MKNKILNFAAVIVMAAMSWTGLNAQTDVPVTTIDPALTLTTATQTVLLSSTHKYGVDSIYRGAISNVYTWTITRTLPAPGPATAGTDYIMAPIAGTNNAVKAIKWLTSGAFQVALGEANPNTASNCSSVHTPVVVTVNAQALLAFYNATTDTGNCNTAANVNFSLINTNSGAVSYPLTVTYKIGAAGSVQTAPAIAAGYTLQIPAIGANATASDILSKVIMLSITDSHGTNYLNASNISRNYTAYATPSSAPISHD
jgi:hypothetical protein